MALRDELLSDLDDYRGIAGELGFRMFSAVEVVVIEWTGSRPGEGSPTKTRTLLTVAHGAYPPKVVLLTTADHVASGGDLREALYEIGPLTPSYGSGGVSIDDILPPTTRDTPREIYWRLTGPGGEVIWCEQVSTDTDKALRYMVQVKRTGKRIE